MKITSIVVLWLGLCLGHLNAQQQGGMVEYQYFATEEKMETVYAEMAEKFPDRWRSYEATARSTNQSMRELKFALYFLGPRAIYRRVEEAIDQERSGDLPYEMAIVNTRGKKYIRGRYGKGGTLSTYATGGNG